MSDSAHANGEQGHPEKGADSLLSGIERDVRQEAESLLEEARKDAERRRTMADQQASSILEQAAGEAEKQAQAVRSRILSGAAVEARRRRMQAQEEAFQDIMNKVRVELAHRIGSAGYRSVLVDLIAEAAVGLGVSEAFVNTSAQERAVIDQELLAEAEKKAKSVSGLKVGLELADRPPLHGQGVVLYSKDNRLAFSNQIDTRIKRKTGQIRDRVQRELFGD
jgi:vacuolar-type H+-ATPase subunit E/Vma4